ncbi:MAG: SDR family oxidoreductase [Nocardioides sp.]|uniref:SDR family NAD(P)-dependent oxidoreductase n=1 Tax=Nocardioides sp. TaxID=35761 RepID=UPI0039E37AFC
MTTQKAALVTGASSGIGLAIAEMLAEEGHGVTLTARRVEKLDDAVAGLRDKGYDVQAASGRIGGEEGIEKRLVDAHLEQYGRLDVLVNNAGLATEVPLEEMPDNRIELQISVNLRSVMSFYRAALPALRAAAADRGNALVVNTSSVSAHDPKPGLAVYGATKAALATLTRAMNTEVSQDGIRSCSLAPGYVATPMTDHIDNIPRDQMIQPSDLAEIVRALLRLSPACVIPEVTFQRAGGLNW